ncbi:YqiJ family protein [uncultured Roseobacter sp.]|uniref:YqiJ family protein n=1 Tax=uncultured Roseobacter sp. TaxID=114847 RepID=UPI002620EB92|nr:YqiJ family protein [uncultured Roseobacter sp.]
MIETFLDANALPFSIALTVVFGLFLIEILSLMLGGSLLALGADAPDVDFDADFELDADFDLDIDTDIDADLAMAPSGLFGWLGLKDVPFMIWFVSFLTLFGLAGLIFVGLTGLDWTFSVPVAVGASLAGTKFVANHVAYMMPRTESTALSERALSGYEGVISQGTARRGSSAEAKIKDRHGNTHYLRVEPLEDNGEIAQGASVHVVRKHEGVFQVVETS